MSQDNDIKIEGEMDSPSKNIPEMELEEQPNLKPNILQRARAKVIGKRFANRINQQNGSENPSFPDNYAEAWYELGEPIFIPFLKYMFSVSLFIADNYFLVKNTINAINQSRESSPDNPDDHLTDPQIIAAGILGMHVFSCALISIIDSLNKDAIIGKRGKYLNDKNNKSLILLRMLAHLTLTMRLFRYTASYLENRRRNRQLHILRMRRAKLSEKEVQFVVDQKKNQLVESHYDLVDSFFKTVPAALLQVFIMFKENPNARLKLYTPTDVDRFATVLFAVITSSISAALYQADYLAYKKVLRFQDTFRSGFKEDINLTIAGVGFLASNICFQFATIGIRMAFYSILIFRSPYQFLITMAIILTANYCIMFVWNRTAWRFHPVLENPLYGIPWLSFDIIDLWINLFVPGVHYAKPLDQFLNFYTTSVVGIIIFGGFDFLFPTGKKKPQFLRNVPKQNRTIVNDTLKSIVPGGDGNISTNTTGEYNLPPEADPIFLINAVVRFILIIHEKLTFHQISYAGFFYNVVKSMNVINVICLAYTCVMNYFQIYDLDFPIQIVNSFYLTIFQQLFLRQSALSSSMTNSQEFGPFLKPYGQSEVLLVFSMLRNSTFFDNVPTLKTLNWSSIPQKQMEDLVRQLVKEGRNPVRYESRCLQIMEKVADVLSPWLYPSRFREPRLNWDDVQVDKDSILKSLEGHPLAVQLGKFVESLYDNLDPDGKLVLAVYCANLNEIATQYTSLRLKRTFEFLDIPIEKGEIFARMRSRVQDQNREQDGDEDESGENRPKIGYWRRLVRQVRSVGKIDEVVHLN